MQEAETSREIVLPQVSNRYGPDEIASWYKRGLWRRETLFDLVALRARRDPHKHFVDDGVTSLTHAELWERSIRLAAGLRAAGVRAGDRVVCQLPNWTEFVLVAAAVSRLGGILVPIQPIYRDDEVGFILEHSEPRAVITCGDFHGFDHLGMFNPLLLPLNVRPVLVAVRADGDGAVALDEMLEEAPLDVLDRELGPGPTADDPFLIIYTSGTTARPKGCLHTSNTMHATAFGMAHGFALSEDDVVFGPSPITHATGLITSVLMPLLVGASCRLLDRWEPARALARIGEGLCTVTVTATAFLQMIMDTFDPQVHDMSSMRIWGCAGSPIPGAAVRRANSTFDGLQVLSLYGRSENFVATMCGVDDLPERSVTSDGAAITGATVTVVDADGRRLGPGEEGDIAYSGPSHMLGYFRDPEATAQLFTPDGASRSGDLGYQNDAGFLRVTGRLKDIVIRGGLNISARELEDLLLEHPEVRAVAVVGMPDPRLGEKVCAYVVPTTPDSGLTLQTLTSYLRELRVATPKLPERLELVPTLPLTSTGKVQKHVLRGAIAKKLAENGQI